MTTTTSIESAGVEIRALAKTFGSKTVVDNLDLAVRPGELVSLLGPSGCGKTTTLRMVAGFLAADRGSVRVDGTELTGLPPERRPSAMVFQNYALWPHMSVFKNVAYPLRLRKMAKAEVERRVMEALELVSLTHHRDSRPATISGGEQQRVALARALVQEPKVLLLDEPLSNLDAKLRVRVREDIRSLQQRLGITTLLVTHDQDEALSMSDRIAVMNGGRIEQFSTPDELYREPRTEFVAGFVGSLNRFEGRLAGLRLRPEPGTVSAVRPEDVLLVPGRRDAVVRRVVPRGAFHEVVLDADGLGLRAVTVGAGPRVDEAVGVDVRRVMTFRDGVRVG